MDDLTKEQLVLLGKALDDVEAELQEAIARASEHARPVTLDQQSVGRVSRGDALQQQALAASSKRSLELRLALVRSARAAMTEGEYGYCKRCEEPIGFRRLSARPEAPLCLTCQGGREG